MTRKMKDSGVEWIGEIPEHWKILRGKNVLNLLKRPVEDGSEVITCFRDGQVTLRSNRREDGFTFSDKEIGYQGILKGDLVIHGMDGFAGAIGISDSNGKGSPVLNVCLPKDNSFGVYIKYYLRMLASQNVFIALATGIRERSCDLRWNKIANLEFIVPPIKEQEDISMFLDKKCSAIDKLISNKEKVIEKLKEYKQSIITEAVTKGLNPDVKMKDSGVEWIGDIPEHWNITPLKYTVEYNKYNLSEKTEDDLNISYIDIGSVTNEEGIKEIQYFDFKNAPSRARRIVKTGDTIISTVRTYLKAIAYISDEYNNFICSTGFAVCTPKDCYIDKYMFYCLHAEWFVSIVESISVGISYPAINTTNLMNLKNIVPPIQEQREIVDYLNQKCLAIDKLITNKEKVIEKLTEYKKSLIYECVTGKREVQ